MGKLYLTVSCPKCGADRQAECRGKDAAPGMPHAERLDWLRELEEVV